MKRQMGFRVFERRNIPRKFWGGLMGFIHIDKDELREALGISLGPSQDGKMQAEWIIEGIVDGEQTFATIYDYRGDFNPMHIGGTTRSLDLVKFVFPDTNVTDRDGNGIYITEPEPFDGNVDPSDREDSQ